MDEREFYTAIARSLYWGYMNDTTGTPGRWADLDKEERKLWQRMAHRAIRRAAELRSPEPLDGESQAVQ